MISLKKHNDGFTLVELFIVFVVLCGLIFLVLNTYKGIEAKERNDTRTAALSKIQATIEAYFTRNSHYPSRTDMNSPAWLAKNLPKLDPSVLIDPSNKARSEQLGSGSPTYGEYTYNPTQADGTTPCEKDDTTCAKYSLSVKYQGTVNGSDTLTLHDLN